LSSFNNFITACLTAGFVFFYSIGNYAQDQSVADSLKKIYLEDKLSGEAKLELLRNLSFNEVNDLELSLEYAEELIALSKLENNQLYLYRGFRQKGDIDRLLGNLDIALDSYFKAEVAAINATYISGEGIANMCIADTYS